MVTAEARLTLLMHQSNEQPIEKPFTRYGHVIVIACGLFAGMWIQRTGRQRIAGVCADRPSRSPESVASVIVTPSALRWSWTRTPVANQQVLQHQLKGMQHRHYGTH
jgi:hypothetical protein